MTPQLPNPKAPNLKWRIGRLLAITLAILLLAVATFALIRAGVFYSLYTWLLYIVIDLTGFDLWVSRAITLGLLVILWFFPWQLLVLPWIGSPGKRAATLIAITAITLISMEFVTRDVYFSRNDGRPLKYYVQTLEGYKLAVSPGTDPVYGIPYRPINQEVAKHYLIWKKRGGKIQDPSLPKGQYFSPATGDPLRWYARLPDGHIDMFTLPGFHPKFGTRLVPATADIVAVYEAQQQEAARQRQEEQARRQRREAEELQRRADQEEAERQAREEALQNQPLQPGRYLFTAPQPSGTIDGFRFTLTEVDLAADKMLVHLGVENVGVDRALEPPRDAQSSIRLGLVTPEGASRGYTEIRLKEGALHQKDGEIFFPRKGRRGAFVMEFPDPPKKPGVTFSLTVNDHPLLSAINLRNATFQSF